MVIVRAKRLVAIWVATIVLLATAVISPPTEAQAAESRTISGTVTIPAGMPSGTLGRIMVSASPPTGFGYSTTADPSTGRYSLQVPPGSYRLSFTPGYSWDGVKSVRDNLVNSYYRNAPSFSTATPVDVSVSDAASIDASLERGRTISGVVSIPADLPREARRAVSVNASSTSLDGGSGFTQIDPTTGAYTITGLPAQSYRVSFSVGPYWDGTMSVRPNLVGEYWKDTTRYDEATLVDLSASDAVGIDAALSPGRSISGTVTLPDGMSPSTFTSIGVQVSASSGSSTGGYATVGSTGEYIVSGLVPGRYIVQFLVSTFGADSGLVSEYWNDAASLADAEPVDTTAGDQRGVDATLIAGTTISGTVSLPPDAPLTWLRAARASAIGADGNIQGRGGDVDPSTGRYVISGLRPAEYKVRFDAPSYWDGTGPVPTDLAGEYYDDASTIASAPSVSTVSASANGIDARLDHGATIAGTIDLTALRSRPDSGFGLRLTDAATNEPVLEWGDPLFFDTVPLSRSNLRPGTYRLAVYTQNWIEAESRSVLRSFQYLDFGGGNYSITVGAGDVRDGLTIMAQPASATISGSMTVEDAPDGEVRLYSRLNGAWVAAPTDNRREGAGSLDYRLDVPAGTYTIGFETTAADPTVREEWWNQREALDDADPIQLSSGTEATNVSGTVGGDPPTSPDASSSPVYRFFSPVYRGHFYTMSIAERDSIIATMPDLWTYEGEAYDAFASQAPGTVPLYRFFSRTFNGHFYTVSQAERDHVIATMPNLWSYEGVAYYVYPPGSDENGTSGVYRFWSPSVKHHFYTSSQAERDWVISTLSRTWTYESEAFRVPTN